MPFCLNTVEIEHVELGKMMVELFLVPQMMDLSRCSKSFRKLFVFQTVEGEDDIAGITAHQIDERPDGTTILQVSHNTNFEILQCAFVLPDGVGVEQSLRGMVVGTVSRIDDRAG